MQQVYDYWKKRKGVSLMIINSEYSIVSITQEQLPEEFRETALVFYYPARDAIVLNEDSPAFEELAELIKAYLSLSDLGRWAMMKSHASFPLSERNLKIEKMLNGISRIRRNLYRSIRRKNQCHDKVFIRGNR